MRMFSGMCAETAIVSPLTSTPSIEPFSIPHAIVVSRVS